MAGSPYNILLASDFIGYVVNGGSTKPWEVILRNVDGSEDAYIVKLFTEKTNRQIFATAKEVFGNLLAKQFDLPVPDFALTNFTDDFINTTLNQAQKDELATRDGNLKFASKRIDGASTFNLQNDKRLLKEYDVAKLFAFDCLCFNLDRGGFRNKPNLLIDNENFWLIDHEQIFPFANDADGYFTKVMSDFNNDTTSYQYQQHLFHPYLKSLPPKSKPDLFGETLEYLRQLNVSEISLAAHSLEKHGVLTGGWQRMMYYLAQVRANPKKFQDILLTMIA